MTRRGGMEIQHDLLSVLAKGYKKPTHLMYRTNTSWTTFQLHLKAVMEKGLVIHINKLYVLTLKGRNVLKRLNDMRTPIN